MTGPVTVSVVIPVYNGERFVADAIRSVLEQSRAPDEIVVVDDGSTDGSAAVVARCAARSPLPVRCLYQRNSGPAAARNHGLAEATGTLVAFQDADDLWTAGRLAIQADLLARHPSVHAVVGRTCFFHEDSPTHGRGAPPATPSTPRWFPGIHVGLYRRAAFDLVGPFDADLRFHEDIDWFRRARAAGAVILPHGDIVLLHRRHGGNMTNDGAAMRRELPRMLARRPGDPAANSSSLLGWLTGDAGDGIGENPVHVR